MYDGKYEISNINQEFLLPSDAKRTIEEAYSVAIMNGAKVDAHKKSNTELIPRLGAQVSKDGISIGISLSISHRSSKKFRMKD